MIRLSAEDTKQYIDEGKHFTNVIRPDKQGFYEVVDDTSFVEDEGYVPAKIKIESFIDAGLRLKAFRKEQFNFGPEEKIDESFNDPTRSSNFDMADASQLQMEVEENLKISAKKAKEIANEKSINKSSSTDSKTSDDNTDNKLDSGKNSGKAGE